MYACRFYLCMNVCVSKWNKSMFMQAYTFICLRWRFKISRRNPIEIYVYIQTNIRLCRLKINHFALRGISIKSAGTTKYLDPSVSNRIIHSMGQTQRMSSTDESSSSSPQYLKISYLEILSLLTDEKIVWYKYIFT